MNFGTVLIKLLIICFRYQKIAKEEILCETENEFKVDLDNSDDL